MMQCVQVHDNHEQDDTKGVATPRPVIAREPGIAGSKASIERVKHHMAKKDSEKDSDRPHYYSQFWLDVAAGRRVIGAPKTDEEEADEVPEPVAPRRPTRSAVEDTDGYHAPVVHPQVEPELEEDADEYSAPDIEDFAAEDEVSEEEIPTFGANEADIPDVDVSSAPDEDEVVEEPEAEEEDFYDEEEEEDDSWPARGRKKPKPGRQTKLPSKRTKREPRRGF